jgi:uncharacterized protein (DUF2384 family)
LAVPATVIKEVARKLGGARVLGTEIRSQADLARLVQHRLPLAVLQGLSQAGLSDREIEMLVIPQRTRRHRTQKAQPLTIDESDRAVRLLRILSLAEQTFEGTEKGNRAA